MRVAVRNYRRVERADIDLSRIALVAGQNGAGKTSLHQAVAAVLTRRTSPMGIAKKDAAQMVLRGAQSGESRAIHDGGAASVSWPSCEASAEGTAPPSATLFAAGLASILDLKPEDRAKALAGYVNAAPTVTDLYGAMNDAGYTDDAVRKVWESIEAKGWDAIHSKAVENGASLKGQWEGVTGERWGAAKGEAWAPAGWTLDLASADVSSLQREVGEAKAALEGSIAKSAVSSAELDRLRADARGPDAETMGKMRAAVAGQRETIDHFEAERAALPPAENDSGIPCPSCGKHLVVDRAWKGETSLKLAETVPEAVLKERRAARAALDGRCANLRDDLAKLQSGLTRLETEERAAELAKAKLAEITTADTNSIATPAAEVEARRQALTQAEAALASVNAKLAAAKVHAGIAKNILLINILAPDGLRRNKLAAGLDAFNAGLAKLSAAAGWPAVRLDETLDAHYGLEPFWNCSESQQMRVRVTLQVAMAQTDQSSAVLIDRADMLDQKGRNGLFGLLKAAGLPALVLMTANNPDKVPPLARAGLGRSYWLQAGTLAEIGAAPAKAAA